MATRDAEKRENHNRRRRELYSTDDTYRARVLSQQREAYNRDKTPLASKLTRGVLRDGVRREMKVENVEELLVLEGYTLRETGEALGRSLLTIRSWMENKVIPAPFCKEAATGYQQYTRFELEALAEILSVHEQTSQYVSTANIDLIADIEVMFSEVREGFLEAA